MLSFQFSGLSSDERGVERLNQGRLVNDRPRQCRHDPWHAHGFAAGLLSAVRAPTAAAALVARLREARLRKQLSKEACARLFLTPVQDIRVGGRPSNSEYEFSIKADDLAQLR